MGDVDLRVERCRKVEITKSYRARTKDGKGDMKRKVKMKIET